MTSAFDASAPNPTALSAADRELAWARVVQVLTAWGDAHPNGDVGTFVFGPHPQPLSPREMAQAAADPTDPSYEALRRLFLDVPQMLPDPRPLADVLAVYERETVAWNAAAAGD